MDAAGAGQSAGIAGVEFETERAGRDIDAAGREFDAREAGVDEFQGESLGDGVRVTGVADGVAGNLFC